MFNYTDLTPHTAAYPRLKGSDRTTPGYDVEAKDPEASAQSASISCGLHGAASGTQTSE